jgi:hypothetical protein
MVCVRNISVDTLHKGDTEDNNNKNSNIFNQSLAKLNLPPRINAPGADVITLNMLRRMKSSVINNTYQVKILKFPNNVG